LELNFNTTKGELKMSGDEQNLNPQIRSVDVGIRNLRKISIYPMSMADQTAFIELLKGAIESYFALTAEKGKAGMDESDLLPFISSLTQMVGDNSKEFIKIVTDPDKVDPETFYEKVTNMQMSEIVKIIVEDNFEAPSKNVMSLSQTIQNLFQWKRPLPTSLNDTDSLDSTISTKDPSGKEDLH
jgi:hypothetical protein